MYYSLQGLGESTITLPAGASAQKGLPATFDSDGAVGKATSVFFGVITDLRGPVAAVQIGGAVTLPCSDETVPAPGYRKLVADGNGGVKAGSSGREHLVLASGAGQITFIL